MMKNCVSCGAELDADAKFCNECGAKQPPQVAKCVQCGADLPPGAKFCTECGAKQEAKKRFCANCGAELAEGMKFCVECGTPANEQATPATQSTGEPEVTKKFSSVNESECNYKPKKDEDEELYGYVDEKGDWVIDPMFDNAKPFKEGLAVVFLYENEEYGDEVYGYIKPNGKYQIEPKFYDAESFSDGIALVQEEEAGPFRFINPDGSYAIDTEYFWADSFDNGLALVQEEEDGNYGYINTEGKYVIKPQFTDAKGFVDGLAAVKIGKKWGFIKPDGSFLIEPKFDYADSFSEGLAKVNIGYKNSLTPGKDGYIKPDGSYFIEPKYEYLGPFREGLAVVEEDGDYGYIRRDGSYFVKPMFCAADDFENGVATVHIGANRFESKTGELHKDGTLIVEGKKTSVAEMRANMIWPKKDSANGKYGYVNDDGEWVVEPKFDSAGDLIEGFAVVYLDGKYGFIKDDGTYLAKPVFTRASFFSLGRACVELEGYDFQWYLYPDGYIRVGDRKRHVDHLDEPEVFAKPKQKEDEAPVKKENKKEKQEHELTPFKDPDDGKWGYKDQNGNIKMLAMFDEAGYFIGEYARVVMGGTEKFIDKKFNVYDDRIGTRSELNKRNEWPGYSEEVSESYDVEEEAQPSKKSMLGSMVKAGLKSLLKDRPSPTLSSSSKHSKKVNKVWHGVYKGRNQAAPRTIDVPSFHMSGGPVCSDIVEALEKLGYDHRDAFVIASPSNDWEWH